MTILIANIGTSDLLTEIGGYYLPVGFDRDEINTDFSALSQEEQQLWKSRKKKIDSLLCQELGIKVDGEDSKKPYNFYFREITRRILEEYQKSPDIWRKRLCLGRISGVIREAQQKFDVKQAYIFVTNQVTDTNPKGHFQDTCYLFNLLNNLTEGEITLFPITIEENAIDADSLLETYYDFFSHKIPRDETILVSIKGGTPQMQTALKMQAIASGVPDLLFIDPQLEPDRIIKGLDSQCKITSYWRYVRSQKYQIVKLLLDSRWDFQGAKVILEEWQSTLSFLQQYLLPKDVKELEQEKRKLKYIITKLNEAVDYLNFASEQKDKDKLHSALNLYTQCRIYWQLEEIANFLPRLGTFYEEIIQTIIIELGGDKYLDSGSSHQKWTLVKNSLEQKLIELFEQSEKRFISDRNLWKKMISLETDHNGGEVIFNYEYKWYELHRLKNRYRKRSFAEALVRYTENKSLIYYWEKIDNSLSRIDYWVDQRNNLIHGTKGLSIASMQQNYELDKCDRQNSPQEDMENPYNPNPLNSCPAEEIIDQMAIICHNTMKLFGKSKSEYVDLKNPQQAKYYLYSEIKEQVIQNLMNY